MKTPRPHRIFAALCKEYGVPAPVAELRFHPTRKWRLDYAWPEARVALEVEGGVWTRGRHTRGAGFLADMEKYNAAAVAGWRVLRCAPQNLLTADTAQMIADAISGGQKEETT